MNPALQALLDDFAQRHPDLRFATDAQDRTVLLFDDGRIVNFIDDPRSGQVRALAMIGRLPSNRGGAHDAIEYGEEWVSHTHELDGFESSISCNVASRMIVLTAKAAMCSLDAVAFDQWLSAFLERLSVMSSVFTVEPQHAVPIEQFDPASRLDRF